MFRVPRHFTWAGSDEAPVQFSTTPQAVALAPLAACAVIEDAAFLPGGIRADELWGATPPARRQIDHRLGRRLDGDPLNGNFSRFYDGLLVRVSKRRLRTTSAVGVRRWGAPCAWRSYSDHRTVESCSSWRGSHPLGANVTLATRTNGVSLLTFRKYESV